MPHAASTIASMRTTSNQSRSHKRVLCVGLPITPFCWRRLELSSKGAPEAFLGLVSDSVRDLTDTQARLKQVPLGNLQSPQGQIADRRHADQIGKPFHRCA